MKLIVLDCDGTLVDSQNGICEAMAYAFSGFGLTAPPREAILSIVGLSLPEAVLALAPEVDDELRAKMVARYKSAFTEIRREPDLHEPLFDGIAAAIEAFGRRDDVMLGIATGKSRKGVERLFAREGWGQRFVTVQTSDDHPSKPHPSMLQTAMAETGVGPGKTVMVGDTTFDMQMALAAGTGAMGVGWGYHTVEELQRAGAHSVIKTSHDLADEIDAFFARREKAA
ncbi:MAG: HAD-IA family hydrolase [Hyphomicrobium sp.]|jgi:phosphoglycolate phosphatase